MNLNIVAIKPQAIKNKPSDTLFQLTLKDAEGNPHHAYFTTRAIYQDAIMKMFTRRMKPVDAHRITQDTQATEATANEDKDTRQD